ncbi:MAG TPA: hypothetical protein VHR15_11805 [Ktedonobacterales bacterium]|nr:hypothetical protein [Ktedonobacterales bacterium]
MSLSMDSSSSPSQPARSRRWLWIALIVVLALALLVGVGALVVAPRLCGVTEPQRHGLDCDIPLPPNTTYLGLLPTPSAVGVSTKTYDFHVPDTTEQAIKDFYAQRLPSSGWKCVNHEDPVDVTAFQGTRAVGVSSLASGGEAAGVELAISVSTFSKAFPDSCESQLPGAGV